MATKEIVILGGSYAGLSAAHYVLRHVVPALPEPTSYHVTILEQGAKWFARVGAPRAVVSEKEMSLNKVFLSYDAAFKEYKPEQYAFQQATITGVDHSARTVSYTLPDGSSKNIEYYALVIATGASPSTPLLGQKGSHEVSIDSINAFRKALPEAKSIIIAGGGPAGIETAGELGEFLNGKAGWFSASPKEIKTKITVYTGDDKILPILRPALGKFAEKLLKKRGVDVVYNTRVQSTNPPNAGETIDTISTKTTVTLSNGETVEADIYIPATGTKPNTSYLPADLLDERSYVTTNPKTLRVDAAGPRVYAIGDVSNAGRGGIIEQMDAIPVFGTNIKRDLLFAASPGAISGEIKTPAGKDREFTRKDDESQIVPIGRGGGAAAFAGWKFPSFVVWLAKGRDYMSWNYPLTLKGKMYTSEKKWKHEAVV